MNNKKIKIRDKSEKELMIERLNRINGQINGIKQMIEDDRYCNDILIQITASNNSLKSLGLMLIDNHLKTCVKDNVKAGNDEILVELTKIVERFGR